MQLLERAVADDAYVDLDLVFADALGSWIHPQRLTERFGELRPSTVLERYAHLLPQSDELAAERVAAIIGGSLAPR
jgi:hypothetical protein